MNSRVKILLDADVVIDFIDGHQFSILPRILPSYDSVDGLRGAAPASRRPLVHPQLRYNIYF